MFFHYVKTWIFFGMEKNSSNYFKRKQMLVTEFWRVVISPIFLAVFYAADFITITILSYVIFAKSRKLWTKYNFPKFKNPSSFKFNNENRLLQQKWTVIKSLTKGKRSQKRAKPLLCL